MDLKIEKTYFIKVTQDEAYKLRCVLNNEIIFADDEGGIERKKPYDRVVEKFTDIANDIVEGR